MKKIIFVTSNQGKYLSAKNFLKNTESMLFKKIEIPEPRGNIENIITEKARYAYKILRKPLIDIDAGFFIHSLNGFPNIFINFFLETIGVEGIIVKKKL